MPFGFEVREQENSIVLEENCSGRTYIDVLAMVHRNGKITPCMIKFDGREYKIDKVLGIAQGRSLKMRTSGCRYRCVIGRREFYLYFDGEKWYVEIKEK